MAIAFVNLGTPGNGTTSVSVTMPGTVNPGDLLVAFVGNKYPTNGPDTPTGWTLLAQESGGSGSAGADTGNVYATLYYKVAFGNEAGTTVTWNIASGNTARAILLRYSKINGYHWDIAATKGADNTAGTGWSVTGALDPGFAVGDIALAFSAVNTDAFSLSLQAMTASGATFANLNERADAGTTNGDDVLLNCAEFDVTVGPSSGVPTFVMTAGASAANAPAGATIIVRLREVLTTNLDMAVGADDVGAVVTGTTSISPAYPPTAIAGSILILGVTGKYPTNYPTTPAGWTSRVTARTTTGIGAGLDTGDTWAAIYTKVSDGTESGTLAVSVPSGNSIAAQIVRARITGSQTISYGTAALAVDTPATSISGTFDGDPGINNDDLIVTFGAFNTDAAALSVERIYGTTSVLAMNERTDQAVSNGDDHRMMLLTGHADGNGTGTPTFQCTSAASAAAAVALLRLRATPVVGAVRDHSYGRGLARGIASGIN